MRILLSHLDGTQLAPGLGSPVFGGNYLIISNSVPGNRRRTFANSLLPKVNPEYMSHPLFYTQVLHTEGRMTDLFTWLNSFDWLRVRGLPDILVLTAQTHTDECLILTRDWAITQLETGKRDLNALQYCSGLSAPYSVFRH